MGQYMDCLTRKLHKQEGTTQTVEHLGVDRSLWIHKPDAEKGRQEQNVNDINYWVLPGYILVSGAARRLFQSVTIL
jgi:hypothetical protein